MGMGSGITTIRIGTRGSPLALRQTEIVCAELARVHPGISTEIVTIKTSGDWVPAHGEKPLDAKGGGKALFAKELEEALLEGRIDAAVHSMKDMESVLPKELAIAAMLPREDVRDAVILKETDRAVCNLSELPEGAEIGTCSVRRQGMILAIRPDLKISQLRGNVGTRLEKLRAGNLAGIVLASAGLNRLNMAKNISFSVPVEEVLPCAGQGAIGIEIKEKNESLLALFGQINCSDTQKCVTAERTVLAELGGTCQTPVGVYAVLENNNIWLRCRLVSPDGKNIYSVQGRAPADESLAFARDLGTELREKAPKGLL